MKKSLAVILTIGLTAAMLAGCASKPAGESQAAQPSDEKIEIVYMTIEKGDNNPLAVARRERREQFVIDNPNVVLQDNSVPHDDYDVKIKAAIASNELPDVFCGLADTIFAMAENGQIKPVDEYLDMIPGWKDSFKAGVFKDYTSEDGKIWGIPFEMQGCTFLYGNMEILNECGIDELPTTLDELMIAIEKTKEKGYIPLGIGNKAKFPLVGPFMTGFCDRYTGSDWFYSMMRGDGASFTDPEFRQAVEVLDAMAKAGAFNEDINSIDETQSMNLYINRKSAMFFSGSWACANLTDLAPAELVEVTAMGITPTVEGGKGAPNVVGNGGWAFQLNGNLEGAKQQKCVELLEYMLDDTAIEKSIAGGEIKYTRKTPESADLSSLPRMIRMYSDLMEKAEMGPNYAVLLPPAMMEEFGNCCQELAIGSITVDDFIARMDAVHKETLADQA